MKNSDQGKTVLWYHSYSFKILCKRYTPYIEANNNWHNYEEAELECLRKLIELTFKPE